MLLKKKIYVLTFPHELMKVLIYINVDGIHLVYINLESKGKIYRKIYLRKIENELERYTIHSEFIVKFKCLIYKSLIYIQYLR